MKKRILIRPWLIIVLTLILLTSAAAAIQGNRLLANSQSVTDRSFSYQGSLKDSGVPANGVYDFQFSLFDQSSGGTQIGDTRTKSNVTVTDGLFTVQLAFGHVFDGSSRYLEIAAKQLASPTYDTLSPRQLLSPSPYAVHALQAGAVAEPGHTNTVVTYRSHGLPSPASHPSILVGSDGFPVIAFAADSIHEVWFTHCENLACTDYTSVSVLPASGIDGRISLRLAPDGMPYLTFVIGGELHIRHCLDVACSQFLSAVPLGPSVVEAATMIGVDGLPIIAYINTDGELWALHCHDLLCLSTYDPFLVDSNAREPSITVGPDGMPVIAYLHHRDGSDAWGLNIARCDDLQCSEAPSDPGYDCGPGFVGEELDCLAPQLTTSHDGDIRVSFINQAGGGAFGLRGSVRVIDCDWHLPPVTEEKPYSEVFCGPTLISDLTETYIEITPPFIFATDITIRDDNSHLVVFNSQGLYRTWGEGTLGLDPMQIGSGLAVLSGPNHGTLDTIYFLDPAVTETEIAATVGVDDLPIIAYTNADGELAVIHCGNELCAPYFRQN
ncbi:MAG: hypothetical protein GY764_15820 [Halieaceae bacterium]|nr:hypothetical protein [Halieaceae bacterium]